jgi:hypothetical protein
MREELIMKCPKCGAELKDGTSFCAECGSKIERHCISCGQVLKADDMFCPACGARQDEEPVPVQSQSAETNNAQPYQLTDVDKIMNKIFGIFSPQLILTEDTCRNKLVRRIMGMRSFLCVMMIILICRLSYTVTFTLAYGLDELEMLKDIFVAVVIYFIVCIVVTMIFKFDKCEDNLKKYDTSAKGMASAKQAILDAQNNASNKRIRHIIFGILILAAVIFEFFS